MDRINIGKSHDEIPKVGAERFADMTTYLEYIKKLEGDIDGIQTSLEATLTEVRDIADNPRGLTEEQIEYHNRLSRGLSDIKTLLERLAQLSQRESVRVTGEKNSN